jgi:hypothetical protein
MNPAAGFLSAPRPGVGGAVSDRSPRRTNAATAALLTVLAGVFACPRASAAQIPNFRHVFIIVMENHEYSDVIGNPAAPYFNRLANEHGLATNAFGVAHPSLLNYMALTGGETFFTFNCTGCETPAANIADQIEASGRTWTAYMEDMPGTCGAADSGLYVTRHNPFVHYTNIVSNAARCSNVVPFTRFSTDLAANTLAHYVWITPNLCNDMHDCSIATGDAWLASVVPQILQSPAFADSVLFLTFDEGTSNLGGGGRIPFVVVSPWTPAGLRSATTIDHYSVLRTIEDAWGLPPLGQSANATAMSDFFPRPGATPTEQVIYASDARAIVGNWRAVSDTSAAAGVKLSSSDAGAAAIAAPQAAPASYFEATFQAEPGTRYRVWLRIHAIDDVKWNDSVFVQFSDSIDSQGAPVYRIGTTGGYTVNLWTCGTCQSFGWGWQRNAYWLADTGDVWFPASGTHTIRVQVREDGVEIDQIVISPAQYANAAPGPVTGDSTIVPKPSGSPPPPPAPPPPPPTSTPFTGTPIALPGAIRASDFDNGGEGVAYHDTTGGNTGGAYRQTDVDLQASTDGGNNVGWIAAGEWLNYTVKVTSAGSYAVTFRVASSGQGGTFHLEMNGANVTGPITIPNTGAWQAWQSVTKTVTLAAGTQIARVVMDTGGPGGAVGNINSITFTSASTAPPTSTPFTGTPVSLPGVVQAENFDNGGEGVAYHDATSGNSGGAYRSTDVDLEPASAGGYNVGWVTPGEWLNYTVNVTSTGSYTITFRVAASGQGGSFHLEINGANVTGPITIPNTGAWQAWQTLTTSVRLNAGVQIARLVMDTNGSIAVGNFDSIEFGLTGA